MNKKYIHIIIILILVLVFTKPYIKKVKKISEAWNEYLEVLQSEFDIKVKMKNVLTGNMRLTLDDIYNFEYMCEVTPLSAGGYGPHCHSYMNGEYMDFGGVLWYKHEKEITSLLKKYNDYIIKDNAEYIFKIKNEKKLIEFFKELMKIDDMNKAYKVCKSITEKYKACPTRYMYVRNVTVDGELYGGYDLFQWAISNNL